jgi:Zn ribbon nucleic-acid-binding protein
MQGCQHERTEFLYRRDGVEYVRCLECGHVFEAEDLEKIPVYEEDEEEKPKKRR